MFSIKFNLLNKTIRGEIISIKKTTLVFSFVLVLFLLVGAVSASDEGDILQNSTDAIEVEDAHFSKVSNTNYIKGNSFDVDLLDSDESGIANKSVYFTINSKTFKRITNENGTAKLILNIKKGSYTIKYNFNESEYNPIAASKKILVLENSVSSINGSAYTAYVGFKNPYTVTLTAGGVPLSGRTVTFNISGKILEAKTNSKGQTTLNIDLAKGKYTIKYSYAGEENINKCSGSSKLTVIKGMPVSIKKANSVVYRHKTSSPFKIKLLDARKNPLSYQKVVFKVNKKSYTKKTDKNGVATLNIKLSRGNYNIKVSFGKTSVYNACSKTFKISVKSKLMPNNGYWLRSFDMNNVNFKYLKSLGTKHLLLNYYALQEHGTKKVEKFIKNANYYGMKVHIWMQVFYNGNWINPVKNGKINYDLINSKVKTAVKYAKIKGVAGVHFDYLRYPGTAYKYKNGVNAINYFVKQAATKIHKINPNLLVSAALMPEPSSMKYYYGQDVATISKYLDALVPMVYKGNYHAGSSWIKSVTSYFVKQSKGAKVWTGLQSYRSDSDTRLLPASELLNDARAASNGGANGVFIFRFGFTKYINFNKV